MGSSAISNFGLYSENGLSSYNPPDNFSEELGVRISDFRYPKGYWKNTERESRYEN